MDTERFRVLLIEDNAGDVYLFEKALANTGLDCELTVIDDGAQALAFAKGLGTPGPVPDIAVLDLNLPKHDGIEVLEALRHNQHLCRVPVMIMTSSASPRERLRLEQFGIECYLTKPLNLDDFLRAGQVVGDLLLKHRVLKGQTSHGR